MGSLILFNLAIGLILFWLITTSLQQCKYRKFQIKTTCEQHITTANSFENYAYTCIYNPKLHSLSVRHDVTHENMYSETESMWGR